MKTSSNSPKSNKSEDVHRWALDLVEYGRWGIKHKGILEKRDRAKRYYRGEHPIKNRDPRSGRKVWNKFAQIARNRLSHIVAKRPKWKFKPKQEEALYGAEAINNILGDVLWEKIKWEKKGKQSVIEARDVGYSHVKIVVRSDGFPDAIPLKATEIIYDPQADHDASSRRFWCHVYKMGVSEIKRKYNKDVSPDRELENLKSYSHTLTSSYNKNDSNTAPISAWRNVKFREGQQWIPDFFGMATVYELWVDDPTLEPIPYNIEETKIEHTNLINGIEINVDPFENHPKHIKDHEKFLAQMDEVKDAIFIPFLTNHIKKHMIYEQRTHRDKYPSGRKIVFTKEVLLEDNPNPIAENMRPGCGINFNDLLLKWNYDEDGSYEGRAGVADLFDPQDALNHRKNAIYQMINRLNHGVKTIIDRSYQGLRGNLKSMGNLIAAIIPVKQHDDFKIDYGPQFPSQIFDDLFHTDQSMDRYADYTDITSGIFPKGSPPGVTVNQLLTEGLKPINLVVSNYAQMLQEMARTMIVLMIEYVPDNIKFRIVDDKKKYQYVKWESLKEAAGLYDIFIDVESMYSTTRQQLLDEAARLYEIGVYDRQAVLEKIDDPDKWETLQRTSEIEMLKNAVEILQENNKELEGERKRLEQNIRALNLKGDNAEKSKK